MKCHHLQVSILKIKFRVVERENTRIKASKYLVIIFGLRRNYLIIVTLKPFVVNMFMNFLFVIWSRRQLRRGLENISRLKSVSIMGLIHVLVFLSINGLN